MLMSQTIIPLKVFLLIDGLDEFEGDHEELAALFHNISNSHNVKVCLSSRPWVIFQETYCSCSSLRLQDLTFNDIKMYVDGRFDSNPAFCRLQKEEPDSADLLRKEVIVRADGVFLWVQIVVKSLLDGIRNRDDIDILRQRLERMPRELEPLYQHLFNLIEPVYMLWASKAFQIARAVREHSSARGADTDADFDISQTGNHFDLYLFFLAISERPLSLEKVRGAVLHEEIYNLVQACTEEFIMVKSRDIPVQLTARCAGLLEVVQFENFGIHARIQWLHRTARDFLEQGDVWSSILQHTSDTTFDPNLYLLKASILWLQAQINSGHDDSTHSARYAPALDVLMYAYYAKDQTEANKTKTVLLEVLDRIMTGCVLRNEVETPHIIPDRIPSWTDKVLDDLGIPPSMGFICLATLYSQCSFVAAKLAKVSQFERASIASKILLQVLPSKGFSPKFNLPLLRPEIVSLLLEHGADPNYEQTIWKNVLCRAGKFGVPQIQSEFVRIMYCW